MNAPSSLHLAGFSNQKTNPKMIDKHNAELTKRSFCPRTNLQVGLVETEHADKRFLRV